MTLWELFILAVGLAMDACAVSICKGLSLQKIRARDCAKCGTKPCHLDTRTSDVTAQGFKKQRGSCQACKTWT